MKRKELMEMYDKAEWTFIIIMTGIFALMFLTKDRSYIAINLISCSAGVFYGMLSIFVETKEKHGLRN